MIAYLSGAIEYAEDGGSAWREKMTAWLKGRLGHDVYNPTRESLVLTTEERASFRKWKVVDYPRFKTTVRKLIRKDLEAIVNRIDYIICFWDGGVLRGGGTHGEITLAYYLGKSIYMVLGMPRGEISSWILGCSSREFDDFDQLKEFLESEYGD